MTSLDESPPGSRVNLYGLRDEEMAATLDEWGEKKFRLKQIREFMYGDNPAGTISEMHTLPKSLRAKLVAHATLGEMEVAHEVHSRDGTRKRLWRCHDGALIESVLMPYDDRRRTACISSQVGCAMGCTFCATGQMGFSRHLSEAEIFEQAARFSTELRAKGERLSNVVRLLAPLPASLPSLLDALRCARAAYTLLLLARRCSWAWGSPSRITRRC